MVFRAIKYNMNLTNKLISGIRYILLILIVFIVDSCEEWNVTEEVSHVSYLPEFEIIGGEFLSYVVSDSGEYEDQGAVAYEKNKEIRLFSYGDADLTKVGVYSIFYYAENSDGLSALGERIVAVTHNDVSKNDLSGNYIGTLWSPQTEMKVTKVDAKGLYKCSEVFGYPGAEMKGRFVDLGNNELVLVHGEGDFGAYASSEGTYTPSTLSWIIALLDEPYSGIQIPVTWIRLDE